MLSDQALVDLELACAQAGANVPEIFEICRSLLETHSPHLLPQANTLFRGGARTCFFECFSAFWFCGAELSDDIKTSLSAAKLASAIAISNFDQIVDKHVPKHESLNDTALNSAAACWDREVVKHYPSANLWGSSLNQWILPRHGISLKAEPIEIPMLKNPFYPSVFCTYLPTGNMASFLGLYFTTALGILDDAADLAEDFFDDNPNFGIDHSMTLNKTSFDTVRSTLLCNGIPGDMVSIARENIEKCYELANDDSFWFFRRCLNALVESLENYEEFCVARLISFSYT